MPEIQMQVRTGRSQRPMQELCHAGYSYVPFFSSREEPGYSPRCDIACTFLGPSRKRGPPKGYIDAIEARLHQTEALLGIMLSTRDERARSLLKDIGKVCRLPPNEVVVFKRLTM
jgi:hypothetical protein